MSFAVSPAAPPGNWNKAFAIAACGHVAVLAAVFLLAHASPKPAAETVMTVELAPLPPGQTVAQAAVQPVQPLAQPKSPAAQSPVDAPLIRAPLPTDAVTVPPKAATTPQPAAPVPMPAAVHAATPAPVAQPASAVAQAASASSSIGDDPRARKAEANYFQLLTAYLARHKDYPADARQARQQGVVTVRFTISERGDVSDVTVKRSSGFATLDTATLGLLHRVSPVPPIPAAMHRETITISLPIEYSLSTK